MFLLFPIWWVLGPGEAIWIPLSFVMLGYLARHHIRVPRGFGIWVLFLVWMACSGIQLETGGQLIAFAYRALLYFCVSIIFIYVYNARSQLTARYVAGVLSAYWVILVIGGYLGVFLPLFAIHTPLGAVLPGSVRENPLVQEMVVRRSTQFNPDAYASISPRPSAPFLYTNGWGNAYSVLTPFVIAYLAEIRRTRRFWWLAIAVPLSFVPAFLTLNRGMFIGLGVALAYATIRSALRGHIRLLITLAFVTVLVGVAVVALPISQLLEQRLEASSSTADRASLYQETFDRSLESPLFGYGGPRPSLSAGAPSAGTQGQVWMVLFSQGFPGLVFFMGWFAYAFVRSIRARKPIDFACNIALLVLFVESFYYGTLPTGIAVGMIAAALTMRPPERIPNRTGLVAHDVVVSH